MYFIKIENEIVVKIGDIIDGSIAVKKNEYNPRALDIKISFYHN
jgi:hypothetical protein